MDEIFRKWTSLSDELARQSVLMQRGDESARAEARRLSKELEALGREMREAWKQPGDRMQAGIYEVKFTAGASAEGFGSVVIKGKSFVGADGLQFYRGDIHRQGADVTVLMEITRHNFAAKSVLGPQALFTLKWRGKVAEDSGFQLACRPPDSDIEVNVYGRLLLSY